jgi:hypothetical protein
MDGFLYRAALTGKPDLEAARQKKLRLLTALRVAHLTCEVFFRGHIVVRFVINRAKELSTLPFRERFSTAALRFRATTRLLTVTMGGIRTKMAAWSAAARRALI